MGQLMEQSVNYSEFTKENLAIREHGDSNAREYSRLVETFKKALDYKEKFRISLETKLSSISKQINGNVESLETLLRNIDIYDQNINKISTNLGNLYTEENSIKVKYEELLNGASLEKNHSDSESEPSNEELEGSREFLIQRRKNYLENLNNNFKRLDGELFSIDKLREELTKARGEILVKKDEAQKNIRLLEDEGKRFLEEVKRIEAELATSVKEESILIEEFKLLVGKVQSSLKISDQLDSILFACLTASESRDLPKESPAPVK